MKYYYILFLFFIGLMACSDNDGSLQLNSSRTIELIQNVREICETADVGPGIGQYIQIDKDILLSQISNAEIAVKNANTTEDLDNIVRALMGHKESFLSTISVSGDKLVIAIATANSINSEVTVGVVTGNTTQENKDEFEDSIKEAKKLVNKARITKKELDETQGMLVAAINKFESNIIAFIDEANMVLFLEMDGNANDATGLNNCELGENSVGGRWADNPTFPTPTTDHKGNPGKALHFERGAFIKIPPHNHFYGEEFSMTTWFSIDGYRIQGEATSGEIMQYILAQDTWNGMRIMPAIYGEYSRNDEGCIKIHRKGHSEFNLWQNPDNVSFEDRKWKVRSNEWHHMGIVFSPTKCVVYLDGVLVHEEAIGSFTPYKNATSDSTRNTPLYIGIPGPETNFTTGGIGDWQTCLWGSVDNMRIFKKALSKAEVAHIYKVEK